MFLPIRNLSVALAVMMGLVQAAGAPKPIVSKDIRSILLGLRLVYESPDGAPFRLRVYYVVGEGECPKRATCRKDKVILLTSTFDEYPTTNGAEVLISGEFREVAVASKPATERDTYVVNVVSVAASEQCFSYRAGVTGIRLIGECGRNGG